MAESRFRELERWARLRIQAMIDLSRVPAGGTTGQVVTKTATGYEWATPASGSLTDGDKGDITVSGGGASWQIDANAVGTTEIANGAVTSAKISATLDTIPAPIAAVSFNAQQATSFLVENRTDDTGCTQVGRIWLRTDL